MPTPTPPGATLESLFAAWLERAEAGEEADLEQLCREHPRHEAGLRALHRRLHQLEGAWDRAGREHELASPLREGTGSGGAPQRPVEGDRPTPVDFSSEVLSRLVSKPPASTRYSIRDEVARGGMGAVLRVWDEELRRHLAMKVMLGKGVAGASDDAPAVDSRLLARFLEEAQITGQLDHPGIVPVHELGLDGEGRVYFTMKLVQGRTLREVFDELARGAGGWTQTRVLGLILKVCEAMSYAHAKGVIHRDLKPANIMVGKYGEVYVMDWGLAKVLGREDDKDIRLRPSEGSDHGAVTSERLHSAEDTPDSPLLTMDGDVIGTPAYMPPEQARGDLAAIGPHSDVYAVGAMLYHLLAGYMPYVPPGRTLSSRAVWACVQEGPPQPLHEVAPQAPMELVALCEQAMSREVSRRYPDMSAFSADLTAYVEGRVVQAYETGAWAEARKWVRRNKPLAGSLAAVVILLILGIVSSLVQQRRAEAETAKVLRLSDVKVLQELEAEADELWPAHPDRIPALESWLKRARDLPRKLARHRATLLEMRDGLEGVKRDLTESRAVELKPEIAALTEEVESRRTWRFESKEEQWQHDVLAELIGNLEGFESGLLAADAVTEAHGWSAPKRLAFARELEAEFAEDGELDRAWSDALPAIHEAYPGLNLSPQMGLLPIGADPESGLWEFAHLMSGVPAKRRKEDGKLELTEETGAVLVLLPGGTFLMGAQKDDPAGANYDPEASLWGAPVHEVELSPFFLSKYEMTRGQWLRLTGRDPSVVVAVSGDSLLLPVQSISWQECFDWLPRSSLILPSEARWEYGTRAGTDTPWFTGAERSSVWEQRAANLGDESAAQAGIDMQDIVRDPEKADGFPYYAPVGSFTANAFGLHDVIGNVSEFCLDGFVLRFYANGPRSDPVGSWEGARSLFLRGGAWYDNALNARSSRRLDRLARSPNSGLGLRPARDLER